MRLKWNTVSSSIAVMWDDAESTLLSLAAHSSRQRSEENVVVFGYGCFIGAVRVNLINLKRRIYYLHNISAKSKSSFSVSWQPVSLSPDNQQERGAHAHFISLHSFSSYKSSLYFAFFFPSHSHLFNLNPLPSYSIFSPPSTNLLFPYFCASAAWGIF